MGMLMGKVALITGASAGIGRATAVLFATQGAKLVLGDVDADGGVEGHQDTITGLDEAEWAKVIGINLTGVWLAMRAQIPAMLAAGGGAVVNNASVAGLGGFPNLSPSVASKHGVIGLTRTVALAYATQGIRVNAVCPGVVATEMVERAFTENPAMRDALPMMQPIDRMGTPEEIAETVAWLSSDAASFLTGIALAADGGFTAKA